MNNPTKSSYIYPVRSLLTGIQPATTAGSPPGSRPPLAPPRKSNSAGDLSALHDLLTLQLGKIQRGPTIPHEHPENSLPTAEHTSPELTRSRSFLRPIRKLSKKKQPTSDKESNKHSLNSNFRDYAPEDDPFLPRSFKSAVAPPLSSSLDSQTQLHFASGPAGELVPFIPATADLDDDFRTASQLDVVAANAFREEASVAFPPRPVPMKSPSSYSNISQSGIVHLPPIDSSGSSTRVSGSDRGSGAASAVKLFPTHSGGSSVKWRGKSVRSSSRCSSGKSGGSVSHPSSLLRAESEEPVNSSQASVSGVQSEENYVTFRYQHAQDENGHHVVIGREGHISKCEDEPIRTPGAVQGFGVLIAVSEDEEAETLLVRQVSENSLDLLGLSPRYLFSLECFTDIFSESQADMLWDNVHFLNDSWSTLEEQGDTPHIFLLTGRGQPGTDELNDDPLHRREWTCWCAAHRPVVEEGGSSSIIIMEFELERDGFNPLYPPPIDPLSHVSSPGSGSNSSGSTLVSTRSEGVFSSTASAESGSHSPTGTKHKFSKRDEDGMQNLPGLEEAKEWMPTPEEILESTTSRAKPLMALERLRRISRGAGPVDPSRVNGNNGNTNRRRTGNGRRRGGSGGVGMMDVFAVMAQINEQLGAAPDLDSFLKVVVGVIKDLTQFHRVLVYQFDGSWNGQVVAELVDWSQTHELYKGLHFPAADIPAQARHLYTINKVRLLYDRGQTTARLVVRSKEDLDKPLDMTHCYLRAMSPIHLKYLENMGVRASMSVSIMAFGALWGLVTCHSYGPHGMRVSFPVRQMLRLLSQSISKNIERLSYAQRLRTRKLINTMPSDQHPSGYIVSNADDLLGLFDADHGVLVIGEGAKILGPNEHGQEILIVAEYLRLKQFTVAQVSQAVTKDFPDLQLSTGLEVIAGLLYVPLSSGGRDFIVFLRKGQPTEVHWAGRPFKDGQGGKGLLEPRTSFKMWSQTTTGRCRVWTDEQLETAGVLALVYGKFIEVWRQKETALQTTKLTNILLSNASHEVRTPLNHIINYLELALNGPLDGETRENLTESHAASKSLLFTINDLLDLTRLESGQDTSFNEPFDLHRAIEEAIQIYRNEAERRNLGFDFKVSGPKMVMGDAKKIRTVVANLTANALKYSTRGTISVECRVFGEPEGLRDPKSVAVEIIIADNGCGISASKLESIFREFEQVESTAPKTDGLPGLGLGLAVVARIVEQLGGQLRVDSKINEGSRFSFLIPFTLAPKDPRPPSPASSSSSQLAFRSRPSSRCEIDGLVSALQGNHLTVSITGSKISSQRSISNHRLSAGPDSAGKFDVEGSVMPIRPVKVDDFEMDTALSKKSSRSALVKKPGSSMRPRSWNRISPTTEGKFFQPSLRVLVVEDNEINSKLLGKRLSLDGHAVTYATNGRTGVEIISSDREYDCVLMDIQMPLLNGYEATARIRDLERGLEPLHRTSHTLNGRLPIFAVSASLLEKEREDMSIFGIDGWILKPIDFKRLRAILAGITDCSQRQKNLYQHGRSWESGGWLTECRSLL